jgi:hypothetical protein
MPCGPACFATALSPSCARTGTRFWGNGRAFALRGLGWWTGLLEAAGEGSVGQWGAEAGLLRMQWRERFCGGMGRVSWCVGVGVTAKFSFGLSCWFAGGFRRVWRVGLVWLSGARLWACMYDGVKILEGGRESEPIRGQRLHDRPLGLHGM